MTRRTALNALLSVAGAALLVWQIQQAGGLRTVWNGFTAVGLGAFCLILVISFSRFALRSYAWLLLLPTPVPLGSAVGATIAGDALGNLTLLSLAASEPAKALYLKPHADTTQAFAALTAENFFYTVSIAIYILIGTAAMLGSFEHLPTELRFAGVAAAVMMAAGLGVAGWIALARPALLSQLLARVPVRGAAAWIDRVRDFESRTYGSAGPGARRLTWLGATEAAFHALSFVEAWLTLYVLTGGRSLPVEALILDSVNRAINVVFKLVPMRIGVDESSADLVARAIGLGQGTGLVTALVRKVRMFLWAGLGLVIWATRRRDAGGRRPGAGLS